MIDINSIIINIFANSVETGTILLFPIIGEIFTQRSGVINLGIEGLMIIGSLVTFIVAYKTEQIYLAFIVGMIVSGIVSFIHAFISITLRGNQTVSGLALTILGLGVTNFYGQSFVNIQLNKVVPTIPLPILYKIPFLGPTFFNQNYLVYFSYLIVFLSWFLLFKTKTGIRLRAVGQNAQASNAMGLNVFNIRYCCTFFGGLMAGAGGSYLILRCAPFWLDNITAGRGWLAFALVIFSMWNPIYAIAGAYLFGITNAIQFQLQSIGTNIPSSILSAQPYLITFVLIVISTILVKKKYIGVPKELGVSFAKEEK